MGGIIPGILMGVVLILWNTHVSRKRNYRNDDANENMSGREKLRVLFRAIPAILMPIIILGGIYSGIFTPTESAVIG